MTLRQIAWFLCAYVGIVAVALWFNLAILCQGDPKYNGGCGGFEIYIPLWEIFLTPLPVAAVILERWRKRVPPSTAHLLVYLAGIAAVAELGFLFINQFPYLLVTQVAAIAAAAVWRWYRLRRAAAAIVA